MTQTEVAQCLSRHIFFFNTYPTKPTATKLHTITQSNNMLVHTRIINVSNLTAICLYNHLVHKLLVEFNIPPSHTRLVLLYTRTQRWSL